MKLQSFSNFALNNKQMDATKGGKRLENTPTATPTPASNARVAAPTVTGNVRTSSSMLAKLQAAGGSTVTNCPVTGTTMTTRICIEWKTGVCSGTGGRTAI